MSDSYPAILRGDQLEWLAGAPPAGDGARVEVVLADHLEDTLPTGITGGELLALLDELAALDPFRDITDPVAWQREQREERDLPWGP